MSHYVNAFKNEEVSDRHITSGEFSLNAADCTIIVLSVKSRHANVSLLTLVLFHLGLYYEKYIQKCILCLIECMNVIIITA